MPVVLRVGRYRFFFFRNEGTEPPHIHVRATGDEAKYWLDPTELCSNYGFNGRELTEIERIVVEHLSTLMEAWHEHFR